MDYLVLGLAAGSFLAIVGFFFWETSERAKTSLPMWMSTAGLSLMVSALFVWGITGAVAFADIDDSRARLIVLITVALALIGTVVAVLLLRQPSRHSSTVTTELESSKPESSWPVQPETPEVPVEPVPESLSEASAGNENLAKAADVAVDSGQDKEDEPEERTADYWLQTWLTPEQREEQRLQDTVAAKDVVSESLPSADEQTDDETAVDGSGERNESVTTDPTIEIPEEDDMSSNNRQSAQPVDSQIETGNWDAESKAENEAESEQSSRSASWQR